MTRSRQRCSTRCPTPPGCSIKPWPSSRSTTPGGCSPWTTAEPRPAPVSACTTSTSAPGRPPGAAPTPPGSSAICARCWPDKASRQTWNTLPLTGGRPVVLLRLTRLTGPTPGVVTSHVNITPGKWLKWNSPRRLRRPGLRPGEPHRGQRATRIRTRKWARPAPVPRRRCAVYRSRRIQGRQRHLRTQRRRRGPPHRRRAAPKTWYAPRTPSPGSAATNSPSSPHRHHRTRRPRRPAALAPTPARRTPPHPRQHRHQAAASEPTRPCRRPRRGRPPARGPSHLRQQACPATNQRQPRLGDLTGKGPSVVGPASQANLVDTQEFSSSGLCGGRASRVAVNPYGRRQLRARIQ